MNDLFFELTIVLILSGLIAMIVSLLKQPSIIAYIITGLLVGPFGYYHLQQGDAFHAFGNWHNLAAIYGWAAVRFISAKTFR